MLNAQLTFPEYYEKIKAQPTYFILGVQGSGTNFVARLLRSALGVSVVTDRSLIFNAAVQVCKKPTSDSAARQVKVVCSSLFPGPIRKRLLSKRYFRQSNNYKGIEKYASKAVSPSPAEFANFFYSYHAFVDGARHKAVKSDDIWENIAHLDRVVPNYRIILLVRDPRDNALSIVNKNFGPRDVYESAKFVRHHLDIYRQVVDKSPDRAICLKYEELLSDPMPSIVRLASFLGEPVDEQVTQAVEAMHIKHSNFDKWRTLSAEDIAASEYVLRENLARFGYKCASDGAGEPGVGFKLRRAIKDRVLRIPQKAGVRAQRLIFG